MEEPAKAASFTAVNTESLGWGNLPKVVWDTAAKSFVRTMLVLIFGSIVIGIAGDIWRQMTPSVPPAFEKAEAEVAKPRSAPHSWSPFVSRHKFVIVFGVVFAASLAVRLAGPIGISTGPGLKRIHDQITENWFDLIIGNAFGALISAMVLSWTQEWSLSRLMVGKVLEAMASFSQDTTSWLLGANAGDSLRGWMGWYGENRLKFAFWCFYVAAICDDLGIPNFKSLGRYVLQRYRMRNCRDAAPAEPPKSVA
jgi:hypothetical protein